MGGTGAGGNPTAHPQHVDLQTWIDVDGKQVNVLPNLLQGQLVEKTVKQFGRAVLDIIQQLNGIPPGTIQEFWKQWQGGIQESELAAYAFDVEGGFDQATAQGRPPYTDPLVLDLDGDGIELTSVDNRLVRFDVDGDGFREATGWVQSDDGLLVLDHNGDGLINDISELFGNQTTSGFVALRGIDDNADGFIDTADANYSRLQVWRDLDSDGRSDGNELFTLDELGISRIRTSCQ